MLLFWGHRRWGKRGWWWWCWAFLLCGMEGERTIFVSIFSSYFWRVLIFKNIYLQPNFLTNLLASLIFSPESNVYFVKIEGLCSSMLGSCTNCRLNTQVALCVLPVHDILEGDVVVEESVERGPHLTAHLTVPSSDGPPSVHLLLADIGIPSVTQEYCHFLDHHRSVQNGSCYWTDHLITDHAPKLIMSQNWLAIKQISFIKNHVLIRAALLRTVGGGGGAVFSSGSSQDYRPTVQERSEVSGAGSTQQSAP